MKNRSVHIPSGVLSRTYSLKNKESTSIAYHTPSQTIVLLDGDSSEVWRRLYETGGKTESALDYILKNGSFEGDAVFEAQQTLQAFVGELRGNRLLASEDCPSFDMPPHPERDPASTADEREEPVERVIKRFLLEHNILYSLVLELTYRCNERCVHCYLPGHRCLEELTVSQIDALLCEFTSLGGFLIQLTGGEPFLRSDFAEILALVKRYKLVTSVSSNLTLLNDKILEAIIAVQPRWVGVSIYGARAEIHDSITALRGSFTKSIQAVVLLKEAGVPVVIKSPLMKSTAPYWREIECLADKLGCEYQFDLSITAKSDGDLHPIAQRVEDNDLLNDIFSSRFSKLFMHGEQIAAMAGDSPETTLCSGGPSGLAVSPDGVIRPCIGLTTTLGRWPQESLKTVWNESAFLSNFRRTEWQSIQPCSGCPDFSYCSRCPGTWQVENGDFRKPTAYTCKLARACSTAMRQGLSAASKTLNQVKGGDER